jgi:acyl-coenzyme A thioesterase 9
MATRVSWLKGVVSDVLPLTTETFPHSTGLDMSIAVTYCPSFEPKFDTNLNSLTRRVDDSYLEIILPFAEHEKLREGFAKPDEHSIRYGKLFEILDAFAADVGYRHAGGKEEGITIVTASVDELKMFADISLNNDLRLQAYLSYVGRSSMEVTIDMISIPQDANPVFIGTTHFVMVARNKHGRASPVYPIKSSNPTYKAIFAAGEERNNKRRSRSSASFEYSPPRADEIQLIHDLYKQSRNLEKQMVMSQASARDKHGRIPVIANGSDDIAKVPSIAMHRTMFQNTKFMHLQNRNLYGKIFGGYIMRAAFELAWVTAVCFLGEDNTVFLYVHDIQFVLPVNVGTIVEFKSAVVYSEYNYIVVQVEAMDVNPSTRQHTRTNIFSYIFHTKDSESANRVNADASEDAAPEKSPTRSAPLVIPYTYEQIIMYLDGRRSLRSMISGTCEVLPLATNEDNNSSAEK